jgi:multimeric flavodoxin WrbA
MKVVAFNGSPRKGGNTEILLGQVCEALEKEGVKTEQVPLRTRKLDGCIACMKCFKRKDRQCAVKKDDANRCIEKMLEADGILLGSPTYFGDVSVKTKALIERAGMVARANEDLFRRKAGAAVVAVRRAGCMHAFNSINQFFLIGQMIVPGSSYWNVGVGREAGEVKSDEEGIQTMKVLGQNMAWLLRKIR